mmetsp:Transcript_19819/g.50768  ORF Transcript_19819/g.50768 Transcript_19819/m.50768 type:complete len:241 (+) Transcript_19819:1100-1822(+)
MCAHDSCEGNVMGVGIPITADLSTADFGLVILPRAGAAYYLKIFVVRLLAVDPHCCLFLPAFCRLRCPPTPSLLSASDTHTVCLPFAAGVREEGSPTCCPQLWASPGHSPAQTCLQSPSVPLSTPVQSPLTAPWFPLQIQERGYDTLYSYMMRKGSLGQALHSFSPKLRPIIYLAGHATACTLAFLISWLFFQSFVAHTALILLVSFAATWNGACYYFDYFAYRYVPSLGLEHKPQKKKE